MKTLIIGSDNPLGAELAAKLKAQDIPVINIRSNDKVLDNPRLMLNSFSANEPDFVVDLQVSRWLQTDEGELHKRALRLLKSIARACRTQSAALVHVSSCDVFAGRRVGFYRETDKPDGEGYSARRLLKAENYARRRVPQHVVVRPGHLIAAGEDNELTRICQQLKNGEQLETTHDQICPTPVADLARVITAIIEQLACDAQAWGVYHYCSAGPLSRFEFAEAIIAQASQYGKGDAELLTRGEGEYGDYNVALNCRKLLGAFGIKQRNWRPALQGLVASALKK